MHAVCIRSFTFSARQQSAQCAVKTIVLKNSFCRCRSVVQDMFFDCEGSGRVIYSLAIPVTVSLPWTLDSLNMAQLAKYCEYKYCMFYSMHDRQINRQK